MRPTVCSGKYGARFLSGLQLGFASIFSRRAGNCTANDFDKRQLKEALNKSISVRPRPSPGQALSNAKGLKHASSGQTLHCVQGERD